MFFRRGGGAASPLGISAVVLGPSPGCEERRRLDEGAGWSPAPRSGPLEGERRGGAGRGACVNVAHSLFPHPRLLPGCWRGSLAVRRRL